MRKGQGCLRPSCGSLSGSCFPLLFPEEVSVQFLSFLYPLGLQLHHSIKKVQEISLRTTPLAIVLLNCWLTSQPCFRPLQLLLSPWKPGCGWGRYLLCAPLARGRTGGTVSFGGSCPPECPVPFPVSFPLPKAWVCPRAASRSALPPCSRVGGMPLGGVRRPCRQGLFLVSACSLRTETVLPGKCRFVSSLLKNYQIISDWSTSLTSCCSVLFFATT